MFRVLDAQSYGVIAAASNDFNDSPFTVIRFVFTVDGLKAIISILSPHSFAVPNDT